MTGRAGHDDVSGNFRLSGREREIVRLVASGLTNPQIAELLCISPGTVHNHLDRVYKKLGLHGRVQLALWCSRQSPGEEPRGKVPNGT